MIPLQPNTLDLSVVIPSMNEALNLEQLLPGLREALEQLGIAYEVLVIDADSPDSTKAVVAEAGVTYVCEKARGYGAAVLRGVREARGKYIITMDADQSHPARFIKDLWEARERAEVVIASRYVPGGRADQPAARLALSKILNAFFAWGCPCRCMTFRAVSASITSTSSRRWT
jgi:dolichol-phosphate mannosyltransferase